MVFKKIFTQKSLFFNVFLYIFSRLLFTIYIKLYSINFCNNFRFGIKSLINLQERGEHNSCGVPLEKSGFTYDPQIFMENKSKKSFLLHISYTMCIQVCKLLKWFYFYFFLFSMRSLLLQFWLVSSWIFSPIISLSLLIFSLCNCPAYSRVTKTMNFYFKFTGRPNSDLSAPFLLFYLTKFSILLLFLHVLIF